METRVKLICNHYTHAIGSEGVTGESFDTPAGTYISVTFDSDHQTEAIKEDCLEQVFEIGSPVTLLQNHVDLEIGRQGKVIGKPFTRKGKKTFPVSFENDAIVRQVSLDKLSDIGREIGKKDDIGRKVDKSQEVVREIGREIGKKTK